MRYSNKKAHGDKKTGSKKGFNPKFTGNTKNSGSNLESRSHKQSYYTKEDIFVSRLASILRVPQGQVVNMFESRTISAIRINDLAAVPSRVVSRLKAINMEMVPVTWSPNTYVVLNSDKSELAKTQEYEKGLFYIQNLSSLIPSIELSPTSKEKVLDMCAAPGGKTIHLASLMGNKGKIVANDEDFARTQKMRSLFEMFYVENAEVTMTNGERYGYALPDHFDKILLDAPCSGEGLIYLKGEKPLRFWNVKKVKSMALVQNKLIESAFRALKPGGTMVYSTCTLEPQENEAVVDGLLKRHKNAQMAEVEVVKTPEFAEYKDLVRHGIEQWNEFTFSPEVKKAVRIVPGRRMMGFFIAKIKKLK